MADSTVTQEKLAKHTPGPWVADDLCMQDEAVVRVGTTDGTPTYYHRTKTICECWVRDDEDDEGSPHILQAEANARLIAAAPDLLALCKEMEEWLRPELTQEPARTFFWKLVSVVRKAEGLSSLSATTPEEQREIRNARG